MAEMIQTLRSPQGLRNSDLVEGETSDCFSAVHEPQVAVTVWRRPLPEELTTWLDGLPFHQLPNCRFRLDRRAATAAIADACGALPETPQRAALVADMASLAERFGEVLDAPILEVRLDAVDDDACRRFHRDAVTARLLCTYRGQATEWGRARDGQAPDEINTLDRGDASIWKGSKWPGVERGAPMAPIIVHRSPPISGSGLVRFLLVIDAASPGASF